MALCPRGECSHVKATRFLPSGAEALLSPLATLQFSGSDHLYSMTAVTRDVCPDTRLEDITGAHTHLRQSRLGLWKGLSGVESGRARERPKPMPFSFQVFGDFFLFRKLAFI